jgi:hypothetical protein
VVADGSGVVQVLNEAARELFPGAAPGRPLTGTVADWLAGAHDVAADEVVRGAIGDRAFAAHPIPHGDATTWWLIEETDVRSAREALAGARLHLDNRRRALDRLLTLTGTASYLTGETMASRARVDS